MFQTYRNSILKVNNSIAYCLMLLLFLTFLTSAGLYPDQARTAPATKILITGSEHPFGFLPALISVYVNQRIVFVNNAEPAKTYRVVAENHSFASPGIAPGQQWILQINSPGLYEYTDPSFKQEMVGELNVVPLSTKLLPPSNPHADATAIADLKTGRSNQASLQTTPLFFLAGIATVVIVATISIFILIKRTHSHKR